MADIARAGTCWRCKRMVELYVFVKGIELMVEHVPHAHLKRTRCTGSQTRPVFPYGEAPATHPKSARKT